MLQRDHGPDVGLCLRGGDVYAPGRGARGEGGRGAGNWRFENQDCMNSKRASLALPADILAGQVNRDSCNRMVGRRTTSALQVRGFNRVDASIERTASSVI